MPKRRHGRASRPKLPRLFDLLQKDKARTLRVLEKHGVYFDAGTFITMSATLEKVAAYHAVPDHEAFIAELLRRPAPRKGR